jgi:hypothetical protein
MSLIPIGVSVAIAAAQNLISPFFTRVTSIGDILPDASLEEHHVDELVITEHPVEQGAAIADHAYKRPVAVTLRAGWSNSSINAGGDPNYVQEIYQQLLALQASRQPFDIVTSKRLYSNMMLTRLDTSTDRKTANSMYVTAECREVIIVTTQTVSVPPAANQQNPQLNSATTNNGSQTLQPAPNFNADAAPSP